MLAAALPIAPTMQLKSGVLAAAGIGAGAAGGGTGRRAQRHSRRPVWRVRKCDGGEGRRGERDRRGEVVAGEAALTSRPDPATAPPAAASPASRLPEPDRGTVVTGVGQGVAAREGRPKPAQANSGGDAARGAPEADQGQDAKRARTRRGCRETGEGARHAGPGAAALGAQGPPHGFPRTPAPPEFEKGGADARPGSPEAGTGSPRRRWQSESPRSRPAQRNGLPRRDHNNGKSQHGSKAEAKAPRPAAVAAGAAGGERRTLRGCPRHRGPLR